MFLFLKKREDSSMLFNANIVYISHSDYLAQNLFGTSNFQLSGSQTCLFESRLGPHMVYRFDLLNTSLQKIIENIILKYYLSVFFLLSKYLIYMIR